MIIDNPIVSGSLNVQNNVTASYGLITNDLTVLGTINATIEGTSATASYVEFSGVANKPNLLSGSAQIATEISGAFDNVSSSLASRVAAQESFSSSLNATFATDAELSAVSSSIAADIANISTDFADITNKPTLLSSSAQIANDISGAFDSVSASIASDIANISTDFADITNKPTLISSSAQIAADISGSVTSLSSSLQQRVTDNESNIDSLTSATSSYLLNTTDTLTGDLTVTGTITAQEFHTEFVSSSIIFSSGSTKFGNSTDDTHIFSGSIKVYSSAFNQPVGLQVTSDGKVGIGSLAPSYNLDINPNTGFTPTIRLRGYSTTLRLETYNTNQYGRILFRGPSADEGEIRYNFLTDSIHFKANQTDNLLIISSSGLIAGSRFAGIFEGALSSSAQIASEISGAFDSVSASIATDIANISTDFADITNKPTLISGSAQIAAFGYLTSSSLGLNTKVGFIPSSSFTDIGSGGVGVASVVFATPFSSSDYSVAVSSINSFEPGNFKISHKTSTGFVISGSSGFIGLLNSGTDSGVNYIAVANGETAVTSSFTLLSATASYVEYNNVANKPTLISSSAQIANDISGAFDSVSSSLASRIASQENFSSSLDATFATDADLNLVSSSVDSLNAATSSYAIKTAISGAFTSTSSSIASDIANIIDGTTLIGSASRAVTASYALNAGAGAGFPFSGSAIITGSLYVSQSYISGSFRGDGSQLTGITVSALNTVTASFASTASVTINHNFNSKNVSVTVYNSNDILIIPDTVTLTDNNNVKVDFAGNTTGFVVVGKGGHLVSGSVLVPQVSTVSDTFTSTTSHTVTHNFDTKEVIVSVYENDSLIIPDSITTDDENNVTVTFPEAISGRVVIVKAGHIVSGSLAFDNIINKPTLISSSAQIANDISGAFASDSSSLASRITDLETFEANIDNTYATDSDVTAVSNRVGTLEGKTLLSSSAQIASDISGSFTSLSSSISSTYLLNTTDTLTGDLTVTGTITAQEFHTEFVSASIIYQSGSTQFGDSSDDTHVFTGTGSFDKVGIGTDTNLTGKLNFPQSDYGEAINFYTYSDSTIRSGIGKYVNEVRHYVPEADKFTFYKGGPGGTQVMVISGSGNVGIGTTAPEEQLEITQGAASKFYGFNAVNNLTPANTVYISAPRSGNFGIFTDRTERLTVNLAGSVGIGTTVVSYPLHVSGSNSSSTLVGILSDYPITNFQDIVTIENRTMTANKNLSFNIGKTGSTNNLGKLVYKHVSDGSTSNLLGLGFFDNDFILNVVATGYVGIGTTSPTAGLTVRGTSGGSAIDFTNSTATTGRTYRWVSLNAGGLAAEDITAGGTKRLVINSDGNIGIGNTDPSSYRLHVNSSTEDILNLHNTTDGLDSLISFTNPGGTLARIQGLDNGGLQIDTGNNAGGLNTNVVYLSNNGSVGISSSTPTEKLDVAGNIKGQTARFTSNLGHSFGDTANSGARGLTILNSTITNSYAYYLTLGKSESTNNQAEISYYHASDGAATNSLRLGVFGNPDNVVIQANGIVYFPNGSVGIGTTSTSYQLQVNGTGYINETLYVNGNTTIDANLDLTSGGRVKVSGGNTDQYYFEGARNGVGITYRLYDNANNIYHDSWTSQVIRVNQIGGSGGEFVVSGGDTSFNSNNVKINGGTNYNDKSNLYLSNNRTLIQSDIVNSTANGDTSLDFQTRSGGSTASAMFIDEFRRVGIGTNNPAAKLDVYGDIYVNGTQSYPVVAVDRRHISNGSTTVSTGASYTDIGPSISYTPKQTGNIIMVFHGCQTWYGSSSNGTGDILVRFLVDGTEVWENSRATGNFDADSTRQHLYLNSIFTFTATSTSAHTVKFQAYPSGTVVGGMNFYHTSSDANQFIFVEYQV